MFPYGLPRAIPYTPLGSPYMEKASRVEVHFALHTCQGPPIPTPYSHTCPLLTKYTHL